MIQIDARTALRGLSRDLRGLARTQIPFASALALTAVARKVAAAETKQLVETFDRPTPFTQRAFGVIAARQATLTATVFAKDIQARYLDPYAFGGHQVLGAKRAILTPIEVARNIYGNIPRGKIAALKGRPNIFIGEIKTRTGKVIAGVWQRITPPKTGRRSHIIQPRAHLKLLIEFTDPKEVTKHLPYDQLAASIVAKALPEEFARAIARALATAR